MKRIALIGAPGSGKTKMAESLRKNSRISANIYIIDNVNAWSEKTDIAVGEYGTYIVNMQLAMDRLTEEQTILSHPHHDKSQVLITCGTIIETAAYVGFNSYCLAIHNGASPEQATEIMDSRCDITMRWLAFFAKDAWQYDKAYYLPLSQERKEEQSIAAAIDNNIPVVAETLDIEYETITDVQPIIDYLK